MKQKILQIYIITLILILSGGVLWAEEYIAEEVFLSLTPPPSNQFTEEQLTDNPHFIYQTIVTKRLPISDPLPRTRSAELMPHQLVIQALDGEGNEIIRHNILDPRLIRSEFRGQSNQPNSIELYQEHVDFSIILPIEPVSKQLKIYQPEWTGAEFTLHLIGEAYLP